MNAKDKKLIPQVKQDPEKPVPVEVLAENIKQISAGLRKLKQGPLDVCRNARKALAHIEGDATP